MDIAALSMTMNQAALMQNVSLAVTKQTMEMQQQNTEQLVEMLDAPHPTAGHTIDIQI
ncbi:YjfB family protein [Lysinibacillus sp. OL1_EC]|uniref:YjfB family protein n=1 Tax=unclassified Lysinibacillus TaxID=2636778 RepID=UPI00103BD32C|nr:MULTISPECIES: YjfB family protein [unclassified Lysinibacillus]MCM0624449.1 YjfB family protein [Lysinibacillus sp. OL1_EC]MCS5500811.1 YjfB family protein [Lysinibacillus sp. A4]TBV88278.1 putative motility protein [Lysinibacillus sp. OL1]UKJ44225.1 YjfB family protein [Lysinibacillus sp. ACHW1.5]